MPNTQIPLFLIQYLRQNRAMDWFIKILSLIIFSLLGGILFSTTVNILIAMGAMDGLDTSVSFGADMTQKAVIVWLICVLAGFGSLFIKQKWRYVITLAPLYLPSLFTIIYALNAQ